MEVTLKAYAKINLSLDITGKRNDGYHTLDSIMQTVSLFDLVTVSVNNHGEVSVECDGIQNEDNICYYAAKRFLEKTEINDGVNVKIDKAIPVSAGMGGGSTDAAAVLNALNKIYDYPLKSEELCEIALTLGADVPFFIKGGTMRAAGIGELLTPIYNNLSYTLVILKEGEKPSTKHMYEKIDGRDKNKNNYTAALIKAIKKNDFEAFTQNIGNDFDELWENQKVKSDLYNLGAKKVCLSGSGPTVFGVFEKTSEALNAAARLRETYNEVYTAVPTDSSFTFE